MQGTRGAPRAAVRASTGATRAAALLVIGGLAGLAGLPHPAAARADEPIEVRIRDHRFVPDTVEVPAGRKTRLLVINEGVDPEEFDSTDLNREKVVRPGSRVTIFLPPLAPGEYRFYGDFHPDTAQGRVIAK